MLAKVPPKSSTAKIGSAGFLISYLARDRPEQAQELEEYGAPEIGMANIDGNLNTAEDRQEFAIFWDQLTRCNPRIKSDPLYHVIFSWQENEHPTPEQVKETCLHAMQALGFQDCSAIWAIHRDTDNDHVHLVVHRVEIEAPHRLVEKPFKDYFILDKCMREMELKQGWAHSPGPWVVLEGVNGPEIVRMSKAERIKRGLLQPDEGKLTQNAVKAEFNQGSESFQSWAKQQPAAAVQAVLKLPGATWEAVHQSLANFGISLEPKGSGLILRTSMDDGRQLAAKASQLGRWASKGALEKVLGAFEPPQQHDARPVRSEQSYQEALKAEMRSVQEDGPDLLPPSDKRAQRRQQRADARAELVDRFRADMQHQALDRKTQRELLQAKHQQERTALATRHKLLRAAARKEVRATGGNLPTALSLCAFEAAKERERMQKRQAKERKALSATANKVDVWRTWLEKQAAVDDQAAQAALRGLHYREQRQRKRQSDAIEGEEIADQLEKFTLAGLHASIDRRRQRVIYADDAGLILFTDSGPRIQMLDKAEDSVEAALRIAAQKYGGHITLAGSSSFRAHAAEKATRLGMVVVDKDLQGVVHKTRDAMQARFKPVEQSTSRADDVKADHAKNTGGKASSKPGRAGRGRE